MDFSLSEEQQLLKDSVDRFVREEYPLESRRKLVANDDGFSRDNWKMMAELGLPTTAKAVAEHYGDLLDGFVIDTLDAAAADDIRALGLEVLVTDTVMRSDADKEALARQVVDFAKQFPSPTQ